MDHQEQLVLSVPDVLNIVGRVITLMLGGSSVGKMDCTGKLRQDYYLIRGISLTRGIYLRILIVLV